MSTPSPSARDVVDRSVLALLWAALWFGLAVALALGALLAQEAAAIPPVAYWATALAALATYTVRLRFDVERLERG